MDERKAHVIAIDSSSPIVSIIVPVFNDSASLRRCLTALLHQSYPRSKREIIIVDNGSSEKLPAIESGLGVQVLCETVPGSYAARNTGIRAARGEMIAFTDSDCTPAVDWIDRAVGLMQGVSRLCIVGGKIERAASAAPGRLRLSELYDQTFFLDQRLYVTRAGFSATANMVTTRAVFDRVGLFDPTLKSGGDMEWCHRARSVGVNLIYAPHVVVVHPRLANVAAVMRKARRIVGGHVQREGGARPLGSLTRGVVHELVGIAERWRRFGREHGNTSITTRIAMGALIAVVQVARVIERARLFCGGAPRRR